MTHFGGGGGGGGGNPYKEDTQNVWSPEDGGGVTWLFLHVHKNMAADVAGKPPGLETMNQSLRQCANEFFCAARRY